MKEFDMGIQKLIERMQKVADLLYQQKLRKGFKLFNDVLGELMAVKEGLFTANAAGSCVLDPQRFLTNLQEAMKAMENGDCVLLADILVFEISGQLQGLLEINA
jgi:hypothetical protein